MIGKFRSVPPTSAMSGAQPWWLSSGSTEMAIALTLRLSNASLSVAVRPSSVVQTGVKSAGWLKRTAQEPAFQSWKWIVPSVVSAVKSGRCRPDGCSYGSPFARSLAVWASVSPAAPPS